MLDMIVHWITADFETSDWVHDRYEEDRGGRRRGGYDDDEVYDRRAPARRAPDEYGQVQRPQRRMIADSLQ